MSRKPKYIQRIAEKSEQNNLEYISQKLQYNFHKLYDLGYTLEKVQTMVADLWGNSKALEREEAIEKAISNGSIHNAMKNAIKHHFLSYQNGIMLFNVEHRFGSKAKFVNYRTYLERDFFDLSGFTYKAYFYSLRIDLDEGYDEKYIQELKKMLNSTNAECEAVAKQLAKPFIENFLDKSL